MRQILYASLSWTLGMFSFLAMFVSFSKGFGGMIASVFFFVAALTIFPPTSAWLKPQIISVYRRQISQNMMTGIAVLALMVGILASPVEQTKNDSGQAFASENPVQEEPLATPEEPDTNQVPLLNKLFQEVLDQVSKIPSQEP